LSPKQVISRKLFPDNHLIGTKETEPNATQADMHQQTKRYITQNIHKLECGPMPNVMVALPNIGGVLCSAAQSLADAHY